MSSGSRACLTVVLGGLDDLIESESPRALLRLAGTFVRAARRPISDEGGVVLSAFGSRVTAVFGVAASVAPDCDAALVAAVRAAELVAELDSARASEGRLPIGLSAGIASGALVVGSLGGSARASLGVVGDPVQRSVALAKSGDGVGDRDRRDHGAAMTEIPLGYGRRSPNPDGEHIWFLVKR